TAALPAPAAAATLRVASAFDPQTMDPHSLGLLYNTRVTFSIYEPLVGHDKDYRIVPVLATGWRQVDPTTWRFTLRPDVHFHDGSLFTADDAVFSIERALAPPSQRQFVLKGVKSVRAVDPLTIELALAEPDAMLPQKLVLVAMMSRAWAVRHGVERAQDFDGHEDTYAVRNADGTGAFELERYAPGERVVLKAFPQWWGRGGRDVGNVDEASFVTIRSDAARLAALRSGEVDVVLDPPYEDIAALRGDPHLRVTQVGDLATSYLAFDQQHVGLPGVPPGPNGRPRNPFRDLRVRQAVYEAVDVGRIVREVLGGQATPTGAMLSPLVEGSSPDLEPRLPHDPAAARALLAAAGYPDGFDVTLDCVDVAWRERACRAMAAMLGQVGIRVRLRALPEAQFFPLLTEGKTSLAEYGFAGDAEDAWQALNGLLHTWDGKGGGSFNAGRYSSHEMDVLIDAVRVEAAPARRRALVARALGLARDQIAYIPLYRRTLSWAMRENVHVVMTPDDAIGLRWVTVR
ncbi:MAG TPA: ABC transporter substrate-binding protein, partial [Burkholderiaceae bacterium]